MRSGITGRRTNTHIHLLKQLCASLHKRYLGARLSATPRFTALLDTALAADQLPARLEDLALARRHKDPPPYLCCSSSIECLQGSTGKKKLALRALPLPGYRCNCLPHQDRVSFAGPLEQPRTKLSSALLQVQVEQGRCQVDGAEQMALSDFEWDQ